ncbi:MAG: archaeosortase/exosortase family protein [archaeon]|nr:archaeosortase/exosortase family protein [Nanoarchaeota archaeon]
MKYSKNKKDLRRSVKSLNKSLILRLIIWLALIFGIPALFDKFLSTSVGYNLFSFTSFLAVAILIYILYNRKLLAKEKIKQNLNLALIFGVISLASLFAYVYFKYLTNGQVSDVVSLTHISLVMRGFFVIFSALAIFGVNIFRKTFISLIYTLTAVYLYFLFTLMAWTNWQFFSERITKVAHFFLSLFYKDVSYVFNGDPLLKLNDFSVIIGAPCSGIESLVFFITLFGLMVILDRDKINWKRASIVFILGLIGTYFLNAIRLSALMIIGLRWPDFAMGQFHSHSGWIMFATFVLVLYWITQKWMVKKEFRKK